MNSHGFHGICNAIDHAKKNKIKTLANGDIKKKKNSVIVNSVTIYISIMYPI